MSRAGELNHIIELHENTPQKDATGDRVANWQKYATVWGGFRANKGIRSDEKFKDDRVNNASYVKIVIYSRADVTTEHRAVDTGGVNKAYEIVHIEPNQSETELHLLCKAVL